MLECDVRLTKDGHLVVAHDADHQRLCGDPRKFKETNLKDLPKFKKEMPLHYTRLSEGGEF